jgi:hypothetical protein
VRDLVRQAAADQAAADPASGFAGDPTRPIANRYYGYLGVTGFAGTPQPAPALVLPANTVSPAVSGSAFTGAALSSTTGTWSGTAPMSYARQWLGCTTTAEASCTAISGATAASYVLVASDLARYVRVRVTASNAKGSVAAVSAPTAAVAVAPVAPANSVKPVVSGSALVGSALSSTTGTWSGTAPIAYARQWLRCTSTLTTACTAISGATAASYVLAAADAGRYIRVRVTASNARSSVEALSAQTAAIVVPVVAPANSVRPVVSGAAASGATLTSTTGIWSGAAPIAYARLWLRCTTTATTSCTGITGATAASYRLVAADVGRYIRVRVTASNVKGSVVAVSDPTGVVA